MCPPATAPTRRPRRAALALVLALAVAGRVSLAPAADPEIYLVEYEPAENWILLHFNTDAFRAYQVEYRNALTATQWFTFRSYPAFPFTNHYVEVDYLTNAQRYYRLRALN